MKLAGLAFVVASAQFELDIYGAPTFDARRSVGASDRTYLNEKAFKNDQSTLINAGLPLHIAQQQPLHIAQQQPIHIAQQQPLLLPNVGFVPPQAAAAASSSTGFRTPLLADVAYANAKQQLPVQQFLPQLPVQQLPVQQIPAFVNGDLARRTNRLDVVDQNAYLDKYGAQAGALEKINRARAIGSTYNTKESLTPTSITTERNWAGPRAAADNIYHQAGANLYRDQAGVSNRANRAASNAVEPIYI